MSQISFASEGKYIVPSNLEGFITCVQSIITGQGERLDARSGKKNASPNFAGTTKLRQ